MTVLERNAVKITWHEYLECIKGLEAKHLWHLVSAIVVALGFQSSNSHAQGVQFKSDSPGNIFLGSKGSLKLEIEDSDKVDAGQIKVLDEYGSNVNLINIKHGEASLSIPLNKGYYQIKANVRYRSGFISTKETNAAVIGEQLPEAVRQRSRFGFFGVDASSPQAVMAGGRWNRTFFHVKGYAEAQEGFRWIYPWQESVLPKEQTWIKQLTVIPAWLHGATGEVTNVDMYPPRDWGRFADLIKWAVVNDPAKARYIEILNEPEWDWKTSDEELVKYFSVAAKAIHEVDSGIQVLGPSLATINMEKFKKLADLGLLDHLDGVAMHAYVNGTPPEGEFIQRVMELKQYLDSRGKGHLPIYLTEFGWTTGKGTWQKPIDELTQARYVSRALILLSTQRLNAIMLFCLKYKTTDPGASGFSILNQDNSPKPAYAAYATTVRWLSGVDDVGERFHLTPSLNLVRFGKNGGNIFALWSNSGRISVSLPCTQVHVEEMTGRAIPVPENCKIEVGESPIFIEGGGLEASLFIK